MSAVGEKRCDIIRSESQMSRKPAVVCDKPCNHPTGAPAVSVPPLYFLARCHSCALQRPITQSINQPNLIYCRSESAEGHTGNVCMKKHSMSLLAELAVPMLQRFERHSTGTAWT